MMPAVPLEPRIVGRPDGTYQVIYGDRVLASCDSYLEAADWIEERRCERHVNDAMGHAQSLFHEFGLSPASRSRVTACAKALGRNRFDEF